LHFNTNSAVIFISLPLSTIFFFCFFKLNFSLSF
jgi:hypothetical protein